MGKLLQTLRLLWAQHKPLVIVLFALLLAGLLLVPAYRYQINPDGISYISIAEKYADGNLADAVNGYWGPLLSWLVMPAFWLGIDAIIYIKILQVFVTVLLAAAVYAVLRRHVRSRFALLGSAISGVYALNWALAGPLSPDLLVTLLSVLLLWLFGHPQAGSRRNLLLLGVTGSLLYYSKSVGLLLFVSAWSLSLLANFIFSNDKKNPAALWRLGRQNLLSLIIFGALILPFCLAISLKYDKPTFGTSAAYNFARQGPYHGDSIIRTAGLLPPPNQTAVSAWEDVSRIPMHSWSPLDSREHLEFFVTRLDKLSAKAYNIFIKAMWTAVLLAAVYLFLPAKHPERRFRLLAAGLVLATVAPYLPLHVEPRYIYFVYVALIMGYAGFAAWLYEKRAVLASLFVVVIGLVNLMPSLQNIKDNRHLNRDWYVQSVAMKPYLHEGVRVASDDSSGMVVCYHTGATCYGVIRRATAKRQLAEFDIDYILLGGGPAERLQQDGVKLEAIPGVSFVGQRLYRIL